MQARLAEMEAEKNAVGHLRSTAPREMLILEQLAAGSSTPKNGDKPAEGADGEGEADVGMEDEDAPGAVDARSVYIGNVSDLPITLSVPPHGFSAIDKLRPNIGCEAVRNLSSSRKGRSA